MSSQPLLAVLRTPLPSLASDRKRHLSMPTVSGSDLKTAHISPIQSNTDDECDTEEDRKSAEEINKPGETSWEKVPRISRVTEPQIKLLVAIQILDQILSSKNERCTNSGTGLRTSGSKGRRKAKGKKTADSILETITVTADVHRGGNNDNAMGEIVNIVDNESWGKIEGKDFLSVLNRFANEMSKMFKVWQRWETI